MKLKFPLVRKLEILSNYEILKNNLNKTKKESSNNSGAITAIKLEQEKSFIRNAAILPQCYIVLAFTDNFLEGVESYYVNRNSVFRCDTTFEKIDKLWLTNTSYTNIALIKMQDFLNLLGL